MYKIQGAIVTALVVLCTAEPPTNQYLPPSSSGYNYPAPSVPFPPARPPPSAPSYPSPRPPAPPAYQPPSPPAYRPPPPTPSYGPPPAPPAPKPSYGPPSGPPYQPALIPGGSGPTGTVTGYGENDHLNMAHVPGMPYDFNYAVKDDYYGTDYSHNAVSDGDQVKGEYRVQLPDGRLQIVRYVADWKTGFHADVSYEGQASYPDTNSGGYPAAGKPQTSYGPPSPQGGY